MDEIARRPIIESALEKAKQSIEEGLKMIAGKQKLIKIADRSEYGWGVVMEYETYKLASGSDDEKKSERAEKAAERKVLRRKNIARPGIKGVMARFRQPPSVPFAATSWKTSRESTRTSAASEGSDSLPETISFQWSLLQLW